MTVNERIAILMRSLPTAWSLVDPWWKAPACHQDSTRTRQKADGPHNWWVDQWQKSKPDRKSHHENKQVHLPNCFLTRNDVRRNVENCQWFNSFGLREQCFIFNLSLPIDGVFDNCVAKTSTMEFLQSETHCMIQTKVSAVLEFPPFLTLDMSSQEFPCWQIECKKKGHQRHEEMLLIKSAWVAPWGRNQNKIAQMRKTTISGNADHWDLARVTRCECFLFLSVAHFVLHYAKSYRPFELFVNENYKL